MLARIAHELFWLGRSVARAEHTARMLDGVLQASLQGRPDDPAGVRLGWRSLPAIMGASSRGEEDRAFTRDEVLHSLTLDPDNPASVVACVARARELARTLRDVVSAEMWDNDGPERGQALALLQAVGGFQAYRRAVPAPPNA